jgi:hypothetical protein
MAVAIFAAETDGRTLVLTVCRAYGDGKCDCPAGAEHPEYRFGAAVPDGFAGDVTAWQLQCAEEALHLEAPAGEVEPVGELVGVVLAA